MLYTQFNMEDAKEVWQEEAYNEGRADGRADGLVEGLAEGVSQSILDLLADLGSIPEDIRSRINTEKNLEVLRMWNKTAAKAKSFEEFRESITEEFRQKMSESIDKR